MVRLTKIPYYLLAAILCFSCSIGPTETENSEPLSNVTDNSTLCRSDSIGPEATASSSDNNKTLVIVSEEASCIEYEVWDQHKNKINLPKTVQSALACPIIANISPDNKLLIYDKSYKIQSYNFISQDIHTILELPESNEGISPPVWSPDKKHILFVCIDQENYKENGRIYLLTLKEDGSLDSKQYYDVFINYECGSICSSTPESDYKFEDENTLSYKRHEMAPDSPGERVLIRFQ